MLRRDLKQPFLDKAYYLLRRQPQSAALADEIIRQISRTPHGIVLFIPDFCDESPFSSLGYNEPISLQALIDLAYRVVVDAVLDRKLPHGWKLVSGFALSGRNEIDDSIAQLHPNGNPVLLVNAIIIGEQNVLSPAIAYSESQALPPLHDRKIQTGAPDRSLCNGERIVAASLHATISQSFGRFPVGARKTNKGASTLPTPWNEAGRKPA